MKRIAFAACVAVFLFAIGAQEQTPAQTEIEHATQELIKLENEWSNSSVKPDLAFIDRILADDYTGTEDNGNIITKAQEMANLKSGEGVVTFAANDEMKVRVYGDAAVVTGRMTIKAMVKGKEATERYRFTDTWVKIAGRWRCVADHLSTIPQK